MSDDMPSWGPPGSFIPRKGWGHQRDNPSLEVHCDRAPEKRFSYMNRGCARIRSIYVRRQDCSLAPMWRRPGVLPDLKRPRPHIVPGELRFDAAWLRSDCTEMDLRFAAFLMLHHNAHTLEVGYWDGKETRPWLRDRLCELVGEEGRPVSLDQVDRLKARFRARGWLWSKQQRRDNGDGTYSSGPARMGITLKFLRDWGVLEGREKTKQKVELRAKQAERRRQGLDPLTPKPSLHIADHLRQLARRISWEERELGPYRDRVRRELRGIDDWAVEREARRRFAADNPGRGPPK